MINTLIVEEKRYEVELSLQYNSMIKEDNYDKFRSMIKVRHIL